MTIRRASLKMSAGGLGPARQHVADRVVEFQHREMRLRDQQVLVVAMVADQREAFRAARQVVAEVADDLPNGIVMFLPISSFGPCLLPAAGLRA